MKFIGLLLTVPLYFWHYATNQQETPCRKIRPFTGEKRHGYSK